VDHSDALDRFLALLKASRAPWCLVGGLAVNAYVEPVVTLDVDLVLTAADTALITAAATPAFSVQIFAHSVNLSAANSDLRLQIQTDPRYASFIDRATEHTVLGVTMPVAAVDDVLQGKLWAFQDAQRRASKRQKDLADIARLIEADPQLRSHVPADVLTRLVYRRPGARVRPAGGYFGSGFNARIAQPYRVDRLPPAT